MYVTCVSTQILVIIIILVIRGGEIGGKANIIDSYLTTLIEHSAKSLYKSITDIKSK